MSNGKNPKDSEDQLLQDASTLLMFANVAAKHEQEIRKSSPSPPAPRPPTSQASSQVSSQVQSPAVQPSEPVQPVQPAQSQVKHTVFDPARSIYIQPQPPASASPAAVSPMASTSTQIQESVPAASPVFHQNHHPPVLPYHVPPPVQHIPPFHHQTQPLPPQMAQLPPQLPQTTQQAPAPPQNVAPLPAATHPVPASSPQFAQRPAPLPTPTPTSKSPVLVHGATSDQAPVSAPNDDLREQKHAETGTHTADSSKSHKRSTSVPSGNHALSPGPASVVLSRGEVGRNNNAIIAAAALAQAADNPLPLVKREEAKKVAVKTEPNDTRASSVEKDGVDVVNVEPIELAADEKPVSKAPEPFIAPPLSEYKVEPDSGIIGCICGIQDDDGFTIQCDVCNRWQHCLCMDYKTNDEVPEEDEEYQCYYCDKSKWGKFDAEKARRDTIIRLQQENDGETRRGSRDGRTGVSGDDEKTKPSNKRKVSNSGKLEERKKRRPDSDKPKDKKKQLRDDFAAAESSTSTPTEEVPAFVPSKDNELFKDGLTAESYQSTYYKLRNNDYPNHDFQRKFEALGRQFYDRYQQLTAEEQKTVDISIMGWKEFKSIPKMPIKLPNHEKHMQDNGKPYGVPKIQLQVKAYSDSQKQKFNGISKLSLFVHLNTDETKDEPVQQKIPQGTPVLEYFGVLDLFSNYRDNRTNQYHIWGTTKPKVLKSSINLIGDDKSIEKLDVVLDSRFVGNETRFIRKSCPSSTNCEIKRFYIPEIHSFRFLVVTSKDIELDHENTEEELRLPWSWDDAHPIHKVYGDETKEVEGLKVDQLPKHERSLLMNTIDNILYFTECGCSTTSSSPSYVPNCAIFKVKKAINYLLRSTRKISGITSANAYRAKDDLMMTKEPSPFVPWEERLLERDSAIEARVFEPKLDVEDAEEEVVNAPRTESIKEIIIKSRLMSSQDPGFADQDKPDDVQEDVLKLFPLSEIVTNKIEKTVEEKVTVKPEIQRSLSEIKLKIADNEDIKEISKALSIDTEKPVNKPVEEVAKPVAKKKLSFADYKKKMK